MSRYGLDSVGWIALAVLAAAGWCEAAPARVKITSPQADEVVREAKVAVRVWFDAREAVPATGWQLTVDGEHHTSARFPMPLSYGQGTLSWDTSGFGPGTHAVRVKLYRNQDMIGIAGVKVRMAPGETGLPESLARIPVSPSIKILAPRAGDQVWGQLLVAIQAQPPEGTELRWVQLYADDRLVGVVNSPPHEITINTTRLPDGEHLLIALTIDDIGRRQRSMPVVIRVANGERAPPLPGPNLPPPLPTGEPALTGIAPKAGGQLVIGSPEFERLSPVGAAESHLVSPGQAPPPPSPSVTIGPVAPPSLIKPYVPGRGISVGPASAVGAPGVVTESEEEDWSTPE